jgi:hypothetical protein
MSAMPEAAAQANAPSADIRELALADRSFEVRDFTRAAAEGDDAPAATARIVFSTGAAVRRYDYYRERYYSEELVIEERAMRLDRLKRGVSLLDTHDSWRLTSVLGICDNPAVRNGAAECDVKFSRRPDVQGYVQDVADGVIRHVSVGYVRHRVEMVPPATEGGTWVYRVVDWEPYENSLVPIPADMGAGVRSDKPGVAAPEGAEVRLFPCEFIETRSEPTAGPQAATATRKDLTMPGTNAEGGAQQSAANPAATAGATQAELDAQRAAETARCSEIISLCARHGFAEKAADYVKAGKTVDQVRAALLDEVAARSDGAGNGARNVRIETVNDEVRTRLQGMEEALLARVDPRAKLTDNGRQYRGMSLLELGRDYLEFRGVNTRGMARMDLAGAMLSHRSGMHTTSDFPDLLANVANKRLRQAYDENMPSYTVWARRAPNAPDFKAMSVVQLSAAPDLLQTNEAGEFKYGAMTDGKETYSMLTYGRIVSLSRQAIVNDDLRGFDRLISAYGNSARRLENRTVYAILTANANLADGGALFNATAVTTAGGHANLTGTGTAISIDSLAVGRTAMRKQVGLQSEELNIAPRFLIVPAAKEQLAYQFTSPNYVPATAGAINEFRTGGRTALEPVVESILDANSGTAWYLAADNAQVDTVEFCYLDGAEGPVIDSEVGFDVDGMSVRARHDFAAKAIDFRGLYKNNGA